MNDSPRIFVANARTALKIAFQQSGLQKGETVLVPDFICDVLIHPLQQLGLIPVFYPIKPDLNPEWDALESIVKESVCRAIVMAHYFGQPQDIRKYQAFCAQHDLLLVEDNAHGYGGSFEGRALGSYGGFGISSPRKILGVPSGGVLYGKDSLAEETVRKLKPFPVLSLMPLVKALFFPLPKFRRIAKSWMVRNEDWGDPRLYRESVQPDYGIDRLSKYLILSADWDNIAKKRRHNWSAWARYIQSKGLQLIFPDAYPESCPWAIPAYSSDIAERNFWLDWGARHGISVFPWPSLPEQIILLDNEALARWRIMVCFSLDFAPEELNL